VSGFQITSRNGWTDKFIYPPYEFKMCDKFITNFHQPKSTLMMLTAAFAKKGFILKAYKEAIKNKYRFYSYGDSMIII
jgi:S-adenosylmethionine:tRNA ribosyltransferase-isomerase